MPHGHWKVTTLVAGLRTSGITAPCVFDGAINGERFRAYVEQMLAPTLRTHDVVMLDNLTSHKAAGVAEAITAQGAHLVFLPPTAQTSILSSRLSPNSTRHCARPPNAPARGSGS